MSGPGPGLWYYATQGDAITFTNGQLATGGGQGITVAYNATSPPSPYLTTAYTGTGAFIGWYFESSDDPAFASILPGTVLVQPGDTSIGLFSFQGGAYYYTFFPAFVICFREGSTILVHENGEDVRKPVETLRPGTLVKTARHGYLPISAIGHSKIYNPGNTQRCKNRLYKLSPAQYPELTEDLYLTGCHSVLVDTLTEKQEASIREDYNTIYITDRKYRLPAYIDERAEPFAEEGVFNIWHFALEGDDDRRNYGVYANGLLVESSFRKHVESCGGLMPVE